MNRIFLLAILALGLTSCKCLFCIDEDLSECRAEPKIEYDLQLITNVTTELETVLNLEAELEVQQQLRNYLAPIFTDHADDVSLYFFNNEEPMEQLVVKHDKMDANQKTYNLTIPRRTYRHLGVANLDNNTCVSLQNAENAHTMNIVQTQREDAGCHETGLFSARLDMDIDKDATEDQMFYVHLYMLNCASALVLDTEGVDILGIRAEASGFYGKYDVNTDTYDDSTLGVSVIPDRINVPRADNKVLFCAVNMPSYDPEKQSRVVIETEEPFIASHADEALWKYNIYIKMPNGSTTKTELGMSKPLRAGQLKIIKARLSEDGSVTTDDSTVGVSVTLDWQSAGEHEVEL